MIKESYPQILDFSTSDLNNIIELRKPNDFIAFMSEVVNDNSYRQNQKCFRGWSVEKNPFLKMGSDYSKVPDEILNSMHQHIHLANQWSDVGEWIVSERHYLLAIGLATATSNWPAALMAAANLAFLYLASDDLTNCLALINQAYMVSFQKLNTLTLTRLSTLKQLAYYRKSNLDEVWNEISFIYRLRESTSTKDCSFDELDANVYIFGFDAYTFRGQKNNLQKWEKDWKGLSKYRRKIIQELSNPR